MERTTPQFSKGQLVSYFHRHVLPMYFELERDDEHIKFAITTFVISVYGQWLLITAGHCIQTIEDLEENGYSIRKCRLVDYMGLGATNQMSIPFDYQASCPTTLCKDPMYDYGAAFLSDNTIDLLRANGVKALSELVWENPPEKADFFALIGVPEEFFTSTGDSVQLTSTINFVEELESRPEYFEETDAPTFYGKIRLGEPMTSISGMSGGPLLAFKKSPSGELKYWLYAIQSRWIKSEKTIAACLVQPLGEFLKGVMDGRYPDKSRSAP